MEPNKNMKDGQVLLVVGGVYYTLCKNVLTKHPHSFFANLIKPEWMSADDGEPLIIERDGIVFQYVYDFLRYGMLPRDTNGRMTINSATKAAVRAEADFFNLPELIMECDQMEAPDFSAEFKTSKAVQRNIAGFKQGSSNWAVPEDVANLTDENNYDDENEEGESEMEQKRLWSQSYKKFAKCLRKVVAPFCIAGVLDVDELDDKAKVYKSSTVKQLNLEELFAEATLSPFGKGFETVVDTNVRHSYEIDLSTVSTFNVKWHADISSLNNHPNKQRLDVRPYKLVIYKEGGHFEAHRDTVRGKGHIGTLAVILNSEYRGGELEVTHNGHTEVVTGPYSWVAMYGDCLHKINPVTSGTRVSLIYDIYSKKTDNGYSSSSADIWKVPYDSTTPLSTIPRGADQAQKQKVIEGMHEQLRGFDSAVICLQHLYPACQANPDFLKGGDQLLYDILRDHFALAVLPCTIHQV